MLDIEAIENTIDHLEQSEDTTTSICNKLASLYIIRECFKQPKTDSVTLELSDILPSYLRYIEIKREYQLKQVDLDSVEHAMNLLCKEIYEFIHTLYCDTESSIERKKVREMVERLYSFV